MQTYRLELTLEKLKGPSREQVSVNNQWAIVGLNRYHKDSKATIHFRIDGNVDQALLVWNSDFPQAAMKEEKYIAFHGAEAMAWFVMSVLMDYQYVVQSEIGDGVDYCFMKNEPHEQEENFIAQPHYIEISGLLEESKTNTLERRINEKHEQIKKGKKCNEPSSVVVTLFQQPITVKELHN